MFTNRNFYLAASSTLVVVGMLALCPSVCNAAAEVVPHTACADATGSCAVHEVRVDGCRSVQNGVCKIKRGNTPVFSFDYTPEFTATTAHGQVYWMSPEGDLPFVGMDTEACKFTACPLNGGARQTYTYNFETSRKYQAVS